MYSSAQGPNEIEKMGESDVCAIFFKRRSNSRVSLKPGLHHHQIAFGIRNTEYGIFSRIETVWSLRFHVGVVSFWGARYAIGLAQMMPVYFNSTKHPGALL